MGQLTLAEIAVIDAVVKNKSLHYSLVRAEAQRWKRSPSVLSSTLVINPKIDSKLQRRIQCSLPNKAFWAVAGKESRRQDAPELWKRIFPNPVASSARIFSQRLQVPDPAYPPEQERIE